MQTIDILVMMMEELEDFNEMEMEDFDAIDKFAKSKGFTYDSENDMYIR